MSGRPSILRASHGERQSKITQITQSLHSRIARALLSQRKIKDCSQSARIKAQNTHRTIPKTEYLQLLYARVVGSTSLGGRGEPSPQALLGSGGEKRRGLKRLRGRHVNHFRQFPPRAPSLNKRPTQATGLYGLVIIASDNRNQLCGIWRCEKYGFQPAG